MKGNARSWTKAWIMAAMGVVLAGGVTMEAAERVRPLAKSGTRAVPREAMKGRVQAVAVDPTMLSEADFEVTLFPGQTFRVERDGTTELPGGDRVWNGRVVGEPLSRATFALRRGVVSGVIDRAMTTGNEL